jgi:myb proto-oncogene protein
VTKHLPLAFRRPAWTENERQNLKEGVLQMVQEKQLNALIEQIEADANQGKPTTLDDFMEKQSPIRSLTVDSKDLEPFASQFATNIEWNAIAHRNNLSQPGPHCRLQWTNELRPSLEKKEFSTEEDLLLEELVDKHGKNAWQMLAEELNSRNEISNNRGHRTPLSCLGRWQQLQHIKRPHPKFTDADISRLNSLVHQHGLSWKLIADEFGGGWDPDQLMHHWRRYDQRTVLSGESGPRTGKWSLEEDEALMRALALYGPKWSKVATMVAGRSDVQCRERYVNCLDPNVKRNQKWTDDEDRSLKEAVEACLERFDGQIKWAEVAKQVTGRTDSQCKKRWKVLNPEQKRLRKRSKQYRSNKTPSPCGKESSSLSKSRTGRPRKLPTRFNC